MNSNELALNGGTPLCKEPLRPEPWPPVDAQTSEILRDIYFSRQWSFNSPAEQRFQTRFAQCHGAKHAIFMANGTVTLQAALSACGIGPGDEVIVPANTWMATAMAVHYVGAITVFVDVEPATLCIDPSKAEDAAGKKTKAIIPVHLYGSMCNMDDMLSLAREKNLHIIEDCAHMHGGKWKGKGAGSMGSVGSFSFQQSKTLSCGEGGICITNDDDLADRIFRIKHIGYDSNSTQGAAMTGPPPGLTCHNFRATAFQAAILDSQLDHLHQRIEKYNHNASLLSAMIEDCRGVRIQSPGLHASPQGYYGLVLIFDGPPLDSVDDKMIADAAAAEGLTFGRTYGPVYRHMLFNLHPSQYRIQAGGCPVAENQGTHRAFVLHHHWLGADDNTIEMIGRIICKIARCLG